MHKARPSLTERGGGAVAGMISVFNRQTTGPMQAGGIRCSCASAAALIQLSRAGQTESVQV